MPEELSTDQLNTLANHPADENGVPLSAEKAADIEREAGFNLALNGEDLPAGATPAAHEGYHAIPEEDREEAKAKKKPADTSSDDPKASGDEPPAAETIQGGDVHENPPAGMVNPPAPGPDVVHRPLTKDNLYDHAEAIADAVHGLENRLAELGLADGEESPESDGFESLPEAEKTARINEAALYVGNAVLGKPDTDAFRPNVLWAIARALRPKLVIRHRGVTPEV